MPKHQDLSGGFTQTTNIAIDDSRLSLEAQAVLTKLLRWPDSWEHNVKEIKKHCSSGEFTIRKALKELEKYGYLERKQSAGSRGHFGKMVWEIYDPPRFPIDSSPCDDLPQAVEPQADLPQAVNQRQIILTSNNTESNNTEANNSNSCKCSFPPEAGKTAAGDVFTESNNFSSESWRTGWDDLHLEMFDIYQECCPNLQPCFKMTDSLAEAMDVFLNSRNYEMDDWAYVCEEANRTGFLVGLNDKGFKAGIFFLLKPQTFRKVTEGWYDRKSRAERAKTMEGRQLDEDELRAIQEALSQE